MTDFPQLFTLIHDIAWYLFVWSRENPVLNINGPMFNSRTTKYYVHLLLASSSSRTMMTTTMTMMASPNIFNGHLNTWWTWISHSQCWSHSFTIFFNSIIFLCIFSLELVKNSHANCFWFLSLFSLYLLATFHCSPCFTLVSIRKK